MTTIKAHVSSSELEARYKRAVDPIGKSRCGCCRADMRSMRSRSYCRALRAGCERWSNATTRAVRGRSAISEAATEPSRRSSHPKRWRLSRSGSRRRLMTAGFERDRRLRAGFHGVQAVHDQRGWDALIAIGYAIQQPRPRHPEAASDEDRCALKKA